MAGTAAPLTLRGFELIFHSSQGIRVNGGRGGGRRPRAQRGLSRAGRCHRIPETTYLVLTPEGFDGRGEAKVAAAGGTVVANYKQIGVLVARSTNTAFETSVAGSGVRAVASTTGLGTALDDDETVETVESATQEATGNPTGEPLWGLQWDMPQIDLARRTR